MSKKKNKDKCGVVTSYTVDTNDTISYIVENTVKRLIKSLRTYNKRAYKQYFFEFIPNIKQGISDGIIADGEYEYNLHTDDLFKKVYGQIKVIYRVEGRVLYIMNIEPYNILHEGAIKMLEIYKGVIVSSPKDKFKVDLYLNMRKDG